MIIETKNGCTAGDQIILDGRDFDTLKNKKEIIKQFVDLLNVDSQFQLHNVLKELIYNNQKIIEIENTSNYCEQCGDTYYYEKFEVPEFEIEYKSDYDTIMRICKGFNEFIENVIGNYKNNIKSREYIKKELSEFLIHEFNKDDYDVKCDEENNPLDNVDNHIINVQIKYNFQDNDGYNYLNYDFKKIN